MIYTKTINVDVAHQYVNDVIRLHEGDVNGAALRINVYENGAALSLASYSVKYDAVIAGYLAENNANATVSENSITVPVTSNMTAKNGTLKIDVKIISGNDVAYLQTFEAFVQRRVINEEVVIDVSGTTIGAKLNEHDTEIADIYSKLFAAKSIANDDATVDAAVDNKTAYYVSLEGRTNLMFCVNSGSNLRTQYRFDTLGYAKYRTQQKSNDVWGAWSAWKSLADTLNIQDASVTTAKIADSAVTSGKIGSGAVTSGKIDSNAVTSGKLDTGAVTTAKIADNAVTEGKIADGAVTTAKIPDLNVTSAKLATGAVTATKIEGGAVGNVKIANAAVTTAKIADAAVTFAKLNADIKEHLMLLAPVISNDNTSSLQIGQLFQSDNKFYVKTSASTQVGAQTRLASYSELNNLANIVGDANDLLEAALNYQEA